MKILITGAAGFLGRHFLAHFVNQGLANTVIGIDPASPGWIELPGRPAFVDKASLSKFVEQAIRVPEHNHYDLIIHCAAIDPHRAGIDNNKSAMIGNLLLDSMLFDWAVRTGQGRVLYISSSAVYPAVFQTEQHVKEFPEEKERRLEEADQWIDDPASPFDDYGWVKLLGEKMAANARQCGVPVTVVRPFSGYGEDQSADFPFPAILSRARAGDLTVWGPPGQTRDWIHVDDIVAGALAVAESGTEDPVNLCTGVGTEMGALADIMYVLALPGAQRTARPVRYDEDQPTGVFYRVGNPDRMLAFYIPKISLDEGVRRALAA
jgi:nucleoside-diphosphate-sugar epimerase